MNIARQRLCARILLLVLVCAGLAWLWRLDHKARISSDVLDLIPEGNRQPELALVRSLASEKQGRVLLFSVEGVDPAAQTDTAGMLAARLRESGLFEEVVALSDPAMKDQLARHLYEQRLDLLMPQWLERAFAAHAAAGVDAGDPGPWIARQAATELEQFLSKPEAIAFQDLVPSDPLLLMPMVVERLQGVSMPGSQAGPNGLVWALQKAKPLLEEGQAPVFAAISEAERHMREAHPGATLRWTGVARFAAESRLRIEHELSWLNGVSLALIVAMASLCLSRAFRALHLVPPVLAGVLGAWVFTTACFDRVHVLVFVVGSLLGGVAVDYGFYLYLQPPLYPGEPYAGKVGRLLRPLLSSALTTVLGFTLLLASDLPLIRQLGVFVSAGLLCALVAAILWFGQLRDFHLPARALVSRRLPSTRGTRTFALGALAAGLLLATAGPWFLTWRDNVRELEVPAPALRENDLALRRLFGQGEGVSVYLTRGDTPAAARESWERFAAWQSARPGAAPLFSAALVIPRPGDWERLPARLAALGDFEARLRAALEEHGLESSAFEPFFKAWRGWVAAPRTDYGSLVRRFTAGLHGPAGLLLSDAPGACWYASIVKGEPAEPPPGLDTLNAGQLESLNSLFSQYRRSALRLSMLGLGLVGLSVFAIYGLRRGIRVFSIPVGACLCTFGLLGVMGATLNLFHLLGAFLGVCLSHNYAIFSTENSLRGEGAPPSIRLSAMATALSFGVLAFSRIPVVSALGVSVFWIVVFALVIVELEPFLPGSDSLRLEPGRGAASKKDPR
jgi:predicted exporter